MGRGEWYSLNTDGHWVGGLRPETLSSVGQGHRLRSLPGVVPSSAQGNLSQGRHGNGRGRQAQDSEATVC